MKNKTFETSGETLIRLENQTKVEKAILIPLIVFSIIQALLCTYFYALPELTPYVIETDSFERSSYYPDDARREYTAWSPEQNIRRHFISTFIQSLRSVSKDNVVNGQKVEDVFNRSLQNGKFFNSLTPFYNTSNPILRSENVTVEVPLSTLAVYQKSTNDLEHWICKWEEKTYSRNDYVLLSYEEYEGEVTITYLQPATELEVKSNPAGIYISDFTYEKTRSLL